MKFDKEKFKFIDIGSTTNNFNEEMVKHADKIYHQLFKDIKSIKRMGDSFAKQTKAEEFLDRHCHIDAIIKHDNGMISNLQEKFLRDTGFNTVTIEYGKPQDKGEWFASFAHWLAQGYGDEKQGFKCFWLINLPYLYYGIRSGKLPLNFRENKKIGTDKFWYCEIEELQSKVPEAVFYWDSNLR